MPTQPVHSDDNMPTQSLHSDNDGTLTAAASMTAKCPESIHPADGGHAPTQPAHGDDDTAMQLLRSDDNVPTACVSNDGYAP